MASQTDRHSGEEYNPKLVYSSKKLALQKIVVEYFSNSPLDFAPIHLKIAGLFALQRIVKIDNYSIPALAP